MTKAEYKAYEERVQSFIEREGISSLSTSTESEAYPNNQDAWFTWRHCEMCGAIAGMRENLNAMCGAESVCFEICEDCVYYVNYGRLDDSTMLEIERETTRHRIHVGNIGEVYSGFDTAEAERVFNEYVDQSKSHYGRASYETVTWFVGEDIHKEHFGTLAE